MTNKEAPSGTVDPGAALAAIADTSSTMANSSEASRGFVVVVAAVIASFFALVTVAPWPVLVGIGALSLPLSLWYFAQRRRRPKPRTLTRHSGPYIVTALLLLAALQFARFWQPEPWWEIVAKGLVLFGIFLYCISRMRRATVTSRVRDAHEHAL